MAATKIGIVYATGSGIIRRWIVPDNDADLNGKHPVAPGETMLIVNANTIKSPSDVEAAVAKAIGKPVPSPRCVMVDPLGNVTGTVMADPALDAVPGCTLMLHATANVGWTLTAGVLVAPIISVDPLPIGVVDPASA